MKHQILKILYKYEKFAVSSCFKINPPERHRPERPQHFSFTFPYKNHQNFKGLEQTFPNNFGK